MTIASKVKVRINRSKRYVFARADFADIAGYDQVGRVLKKLVDAGELLRIGYGLYTKARKNRITGNLMPASPSGADGVILEAIEKLGAPLEKWVEGLRNGTIEMDAFKDAVKAATSGELDLVEVLTSPSGMIAAATAAAAAINALTAQLAAAENMDFGSDHLVRCRQAADNAFDVDDLFIPWIKHQLHFGSVQGDRSDEAAPDAKGETQKNTEQDQQAAAPDDRENRTEIEHFLPVISGKGRLWRRHVVDPIVVVAPPTPLRCTIPPGAGSGLSGQTTRKNQSVPASSDPLDRLLTLCRPIRA